MGMGRVGLDGGMVTDTPQRSLWKQNGLLLRASFTAPDGTALGSYTPEVGPVGVADAGTYEIQSGKAQAKTFASHAALESYELNRADIAIATTVRFSALANCIAGLHLRASDANNRWFIQLRGIDNNVYITEVNAGSSFARATIPFTFATATDYYLVAQALGSTITVWVNGVLIGSYASATFNQTITRHGLGYFHSTDAVTATMDSLVAYRAGAVSVPGGVV